MSDTPTGKIEILHVDCYNDLVGKKFFKGANSRDEVIQRLQTAMERTQDHALEGVTAPEVVFRDTDGKVYRAEIYWSFNYDETNVEELDEEDLEDIISEEDGE
jgi:hypothetical protein